MQTKGGHRRAKTEVVPFMVTGLPVQNARDKTRNRKRLVLCMVCDFFYPKLGGVEMHIWSLSQSLLRLGHKVIVVTHDYKDRKGIRYMTNGLKVYHLPLWEMHDSCTMPSFFFSLLPLFRQILIRESVDIVHGHQASSAMMHECLMHANVMGYRTMYTDHSLFNLNDMAGIHLNKVLKFTLTGVDAAIGVSHTCRENLTLRASLDPKLVSVIPNAVDCIKFVPENGLRNQFGSTVNVIVLARLNYRKGIDLVASVIPIICKKYDNVNFIIGGDGPKKLDLEEMIEKNDLHDRVMLLGSVPHADVPKVLNQGHLFLNCSLTESFCIAILEAAACGLYVVSTSVGGLPEVLPNDMITLSKAVNAESVAHALEEGIGKVGTHNAKEAHARVTKMYNWGDVAKRTSKVYSKIMSMRKRTLRSRLLKYLEIGEVYGILCLFLVTVDVFVWAITAWFQPDEDIDRAPDFPVEHYMKRAWKYHEEDHRHNLEKGGSGMLSRSSFQKSNVR